MRIRNFFAASIIAAGTFSSAVAANAANLIDTAVDSGQFKTLVAAVQAAGLGDALSGPGPFTVFAPTDEAFSKLPEGTVEDLLKSENREKLVAILTYHVIFGKVMAADIADKKLSVKTLQGSDLVVDAMAGVVSVNGAKVTAVDIEASNGVIHVIDRVDLPPQ
ncbi:MAG: fasciclin domain-containing protein [Alphaproteobacteria bacterium]|nr:fasciclin domain-containing protein [Alphaproteobacteria bacterium]